ncbi:MAG TPA: isoprenylcysteine carboxylmethyltransferase family protein [Gemmatimonas sp.]|nr:isoprenylcysteine carboxylmethyltransferase family protein [Gemmatimonas sp.]
MPFPPPVVYVAGFALGALLEPALPLAVQIPTGRWIDAIGLGLMVVGVGVLYTGIVTFRRARTPVYPNRPAKLVVSHGIYAHTRNPMYVGLAALYLGGVVTTGLLWPLVLFPLVIVVIRTQVIAREERHLTEKFGGEYTEYTRRVRRWL